MVYSASLQVKENIDSIEYHNKIFGMLYLFSKRLSDIERHVILHRNYVVLLPTVLCCEVAGYRDCD